MAAAMSAPPTRWDYMLRPQSQPAPDHESKSNKPRTVKPTAMRQRTGNSDQPALISSIIDSFDTFSSPSVHKPLGSPTSARPYSADGNACRSRGVPRSPLSKGFGEDAIDNDVIGEDGHDEFEKAAAVPQMPKEQESRSPSGVSHYSPHRTMSSNTTNHESTPRSPSILSISSSLYGTDRERDGNTRNKLSAESWVRAGTSSVDLNRIGPSETVTHGPQSEPKTRPARRSLRRMNSKDSLRPKDLRIQIFPASMDVTEYANGGELIAKASPPLASPRTRLFLTDTPSNEEPVPSDSPSPVDEPSAPHYMQEIHGLGVSIPTQDQKNSKRNSTISAVSIADSIPTRTSSLRQSSISPNPGRRKERKSKKSATSPESQSQSVFRRHKKQIPDSKWADLGEDDETVKRILQLRERRQSRMTDSRASSQPPGTTISSPLEPARDSTEGKLSTSDGQSSPNMAGRSASVAQRKPPVPLEQVDETADPTGDDSIATGHDSSVPFGPSRRANGQFTEQRAAIPRPSTANSASHQKISLDYSYAQAIATLHTTASNMETDSLARMRPNALRSRSDYAYRSTDFSSRHHPGRAYRKHLQTMEGRQKVVDGRNNGAFAELSMGIDNDSLARRDSTELAVDDHLFAPRFTRKVKHPLSGRIIAFSEVGDPEGAAVFVCVGMGLTRFVAGFYDELAYTLGLRLITIDRPGVGGSEPLPAQDRSGPLNWPEDVLAICECLEIEKFSLLAHSAGSIYALATALIVPQMVVGKVHLLAPWIPPSQLAAASHSSTSTASATAAALPRSQRFLRVLPTPFLKAVNASFLTGTTASLKPHNRRRSASIRGEHVLIPDQNGPLHPGNNRSAQGDPRSIGHQRRESLLHMDQDMPDVSVDSFAIPVSENGEDVGYAATAGPHTLTRSLEPDDNDTESLMDYEHMQKYVRLLTKRTWDLATKDSNPATDLLVCLERHREIGFRYTDVHSDIVITHGAEDKRVPVGNVRWLAEQMNRRVVGTTPRKFNDSQTTLFSRYAPASCELRVLEREGHGLMASPRVMGDVLTEIAGYAWGQTDM